MNRLRKVISNQRFFYSGIVVVALLIGFGVSFLLSNDSQNNNTTTQLPACSDTCVNLLGDTASPDTLAVTVGSYVSFNSADGKSHRLTLGGGTTSHGSAHSNPGSYDSGEFKSDESWRVQFKEEGTYRFSDKFNPKLDIIVVVYTEGKDYKIQ